MRISSARPTAAALHAAVLAGLRWLEAGARDPARLTSDHLLCFRMLQRNARDKRLSARVTRLYRKLLPCYPLDLDALTCVAEPHEFIDSLCVAALREEQGMAGPETAAIRAAVLARPEEFFWTLSPREHRYANCVTLINYYHFERLGIRMGHTLAEILSSCAPLALERSRERSEDELEPWLYFATHWVYALSRYGAIRLDRREHVVVYELLERTLPDALDYGNVETLAEVVGCLKLFGDDEEPGLSSAIQLLWKRQNPDGSWGSRRRCNRTHATSVVVIALAQYEISPRTSDGRRRSRAPSAASAMCVAP